MYDELKNNISRIGNFAEGDYINAITYLLKSSKKSSSNSQKKQLLFKKDEVKLLIEYAKNENIFFTKIENCNYILGCA